MTRESLLLIALQSGALFLVIWGIFRLFPSIPANSKAWIWRLAFLKPLLSLLPFAVITLHILPASTVISEPLPEVNSALEISTPPPSASFAEPVSERASRLDPVLAIWILGACAVAGYGLWGLGKAVLVIRSASPVTHSELQETLVELMDRAGVVPPIHLLTSPFVQSAMLVGGFKPTIVLPQSAIDEGSPSDLRLMLAHEIAHIARRDLTWFGVTTAVQTLFFFNPVVWLAAKCSRLDHESATDRYAAQLAGVPIHTYADMLLRATVAARIGLAPGTLRMAASYRTIHRRLEAMKHFNLKPNAWRKSAIAALALVTCGLLPTYQLAQAQSKAVAPTKVIAKKPNSKVVGPATSQPKPGNYTVWMEGKGRKKAWVTTDKKDKIAVFAWNGKNYVKLKDITRAQFEKEKAQLLKESAKISKRGGDAPRPPMLNPKSTSGEASVGKSSSGQGVAVAGSGRNAGGSGRADTGQGRGVASGGSASGSGSNSQNGGTAVGGSGSNVAGTGRASSGQGGGTAVGGSGTNSAGSGVSSGSGQTSGSSRGGSGQGEPTLLQAGIFVPSKATGGSRTPASINTPLWQPELFVDGEGQAAAKSSENIGVKFEDQDVRTGLDLLLRQIVREYVIAPNVKGKMTLELNNVSLETALNNIVRQIGGSWSVEHGVYYISAKPAQRVQSKSGNPGKVKISELDFNGTDVRQALRAISREAGWSFSIDPKLQGTVTLQLRNIRFEDAIRKVLEQVNGTCSVEKGVFAFKPKA